MARVRSASVPVARRSAASRDLLDGVGDHAGQDEADGDRQERDRDEDVLERARSSAWLSGVDVR